MQKLGHIMVLREALLLRDDPIARPVSPIAGLQARVSRNDIDPVLNHDLNKFRSCSETGDSNWDFASRKTHYGIFSATPKKRARVTL